MQDRTEIIRNQSALNYQLVWFSITYLILGVVSILILLVPFDFLDANFILWALVIIGLAMLLYVLSIFVLRKTWTATKYYLTNDCLVINIGTTSNREDIYRYDTIETVSVKQKATEKSRGYGKIILAIPNKPEPVILKDINNPSEIANILQDKIVKSTRNASVINY
jgi:membrane protein YdbS with pleckstrin-like domain